MFIRPLWTFVYHQPTNVAGVPNMRSVSTMSPTDSPRLIVVGGEALVDLIARPDGELRAVLGGGPYNTARTIGRLGGHVAFLGGISTDRFGCQLNDALARDGVSVSLVQRIDAPTTLAMAELDGSGAASYRFYFEGTAAPQLHQVVMPGAAQAIHLGTLGLVLEPMASVLDDAVAQLAGHALVMVDVNCRPSATADVAAYVERLHRLLASTDVVKISDDDFTFLAAHYQELATPEQLIEHGAKVVLLTRGSSGVDIVTADGAVHVAAEPVEVVDTIGAGDSFGGAFLAWWIRGGLGVTDLADSAKLQQAVALGCRVAAITCGRAGANPPRADEVKGWNE
jgi:fructokinase